MARDPTGTSPNADGLHKPRNMHFPHCNPTHVLFILPSSTGTEIPYPVFLILSP